MKELLRKEHYCHKIYTLLMKSTSYPFHRQSPYMADSPSHFYKKILIPPSIISEKCCVHPVHLGFWTQLKLTFNLGWTQLSIPGLAVFTLFVTFMEKNSLKSFIVFLSFSGTYEIGLQKIRPQTTGQLCMSQD